MKKVVVFGVGQIFINFLLNDLDNYEIMCFSDNDKQKIGKSILGKIIIDPNEIPSWIFDKILVTSSYYEQIFSQLKEIGINEDKIEQYVHQTNNIDLYGQKLALKNILHLVSKRPLDINIETYSFCPLKCSFCCNRIYQREKKLMDLRLFTKIIEEYITIWNGGTLSIGAMQSDFLSDPLLLERLAIIRKYKEKIYLYSTTPLISLTKYNDRDVQYILETFDYLQISVEGYDSYTYFLMSGVDGFNVSQNQLKRIYRIINDNQLNIRIELYFRVQNAFEAVQSDFFKWCKEHFCISEIRSLFFSWFGSIKEKDIPQGAKLYVKDNTKLKDDCVVPFSTLSVQANGNVVGCGCIDWLEKNVIGNCFDQSLKEIWCGEKKISFQTAFSSGNIPEICKECGLYTEMNKCFSNSRLINYKSIDGVYYKQ